MPTYVYECSRCEQQFEAQQRMTEDPLDTCICGSKGTIKRVIQPIAVVFKGSGFHINDYAASTASTPKPSEPKADAGASDAAASSSTPSEGSTKTEPAAPAAAESKPTVSAPATPEP